MQVKPALFEPLALVSKRVHEAVGQGRRAFAVYQAAKHDGPIIWVMPGDVMHLPMLRGLPDDVSQRLLIVRPDNEIDLLWAVEEALRSTAVGLVVAEPSGVLSLTAGRRLQLAAEAGKTTGLMLIREGQGSNAAETRWHCEQMPSQAEDSTLHQWSLIKNKKGTLTSWVVNWNGATDSVDLVSTAGERHGATETSH